MTHGSGHRLSDEQRAFVLDSIRQALENGDSFLMDQEIELRELRFDEAVARGLDPAIKHRAATRHRTLKVEWETHEPA